MVQPDKAHQSDILETAGFLLGEAKRRGVLLRVLGAVAFYYHCPSFAAAAAREGRFLSDIDFASYLGEVGRVEELCLSLGWRQHSQVKALFGTQRRIFFHPSKEIQVDIFLDQMRFCHVIPFKGRLEVDYPTVPLAEMLLEKMQIVRLTRKDVVDSLILLHDHPVDAHDNDTINTGYIASLCARDWGLWRTVTINLGKLQQALPQFANLELSSDGIMARLHSLMDRIEREPKSLGWKARSKLGEKKKWYNDVDEA